MPSQPSSLVKRSARIENNERKKARIAAADPEAEVLKTRIDALINDPGTHPSWPGLSLEQNYPDLKGTWATYAADAGDDPKRAAQELGALAGCHTCLSFAANDPLQPWTGDHCPPTKLSRRARELLGIGDRLTYLFPQCKTCSDAQPTLVNEINAIAGSNLSEAEKRRLIDAKGDRLKLLRGGRAPSLGRNCIMATGPTVTPTQSQQIKILGATVANNGCHTCNTPYPCPGYVADHVTPKGLVQSGMESVYAELGYPLSLIFRPQCSRCSNKQGGDTSALVNDLRAFMVRMNIPVYT